MYNYNGDRNLMNEYLNTLYKNIIWKSMINILRTYAVRNVNLQLILN